MKGASDSFRGSHEYMLNDSKGREREREREGPRRA